MDCPACRAAMVPQFKVGDRVRLVAYWRQSAGIWDVESMVIEKTAMGYRLKPDEPINLGARRGIVTEHETYRPEWYELVPSTDGR